MQSTATASLFEEITPGLKRLQIRRPIPFEQSMIPGFELRQVTARTTEFVNCEENIRKVFPKTKIDSDRHLYLDIAYMKIP